MCRVLSPRVRKCRTPVSSIFASIPLFRSPRARSPSRNWRSCAGATPCRRSPSPIPAISSASWSSARPRPRRAGQPIVGCLLGLKRTDGGSANGHGAPCDRVLLLVQNETGYRNLIKLVSQAFMETEGGDPAQVPLEALASRTEGLIAFMGAPDSPVGRQLGLGQAEAAEAALAGFTRLFPGRLYVEIMRHGLDAEEAIEAKLLDLAYARDLPLVATNDAYFADTSMFEAHDALICIAEGTYLSEGNRRRFTPEHRFKSAEEMRDLFADLPEALDNTLIVAKRCAYFPEPREPLLPSYPTAGGRDTGGDLRANAKEGLAGGLETAVLPGMD